MPERCPICDLDWREKECGHGPAEREVHKLAARATMLEGAIEGWREAARTKTAEYESEIGMLRERLPGAHASAATALRLSREGEGAWTSGDALAVWIDEMVQFLGDSLRPGTAGDGMDEAAHGNNPGRPHGEPGTH